MILTSAKNPLIKETMALKDKKARKQLSLFLVEGEKSVRECLKSELETEKIFFSESFFAAKQGEEEYAKIFSSLNAIAVSDEVFKSLSDEKTPQGILSRVKIPESPLCAPKSSCLLLDGVADPGNMGAIIRTANAAGYGELYLINCTDPYSPKSVRASMSGIFFTKIRFGGREEVLKALEGVSILAADMNGKNIFSFSPPEKFVLAIGNEANGISEEVFRAAKYTVKIPMRNTQESLNAAVSAGIAMYLLKQAEFITMP